MTNDLRKYWRSLKQSFRSSIWLGWQLESNWTDWHLFVIYVLLKPLTSSMLLVGMYYAAQAVPNSRVPVQFLPYMYISNICYGLVGAVMFGMSYAVISDREHYRMLKYIFISPIHFPMYFIGRALSGAGQAVLGGIINLAVGLLAFKEVRSALIGHSIPWFHLAVDLILGIAILLALGLILSAAMFNISRQGMYLSEGISGLVYLIGGVVFPISILPIWLQYISICLPTTLWLEAIRRSLMPKAEGIFISPLSSVDSWTLTGLLFIGILFLWLVAYYFFRWSVRKAWQNGKMEETTGN